MSEGNEVWIAVFTGMDYHTAESGCDLYHIAVIILIIQLLLILKY